RFDLQSHSVHSDGALPAAEVVERAAQAGVELLALSDHDTISGVAEALATGERIGIRVVPAVEISAVDDGASEPRELHILGYNIEGRPAFRMRETPTVAQAIDAIHEAGGVAVWAHPFWDISEPPEVLDSIERFHALGIDGVEAFYVTHTREQTELLADRCAQ